MWLQVPLLSQVEVKDGYLEFIYEANCCHHYTCQWTECFVSFNNTYTLNMPLSLKTTKLCIFELFALKRFICLNSSPALLISNPQTLKHPVGNTGDGLLWCYSSNISHTQRMSLSKVMTETDTCSYWLFETKRSKHLSSVKTWLVRCFFGRVMF